MSLAWEFFKRDALIAMSYRTAFAVQLLGNVVMLIVFYFVGKMFGGDNVPALAKYGGSYISFLLIGVALTDAVGVSLTTFATQIREGQMSGSLEATLMAPVWVPAILLYSSLWSYFLSVIRFVLYLVLGLLCFGVGLQKADLGAAVVIFLLTVIATAGLGMLWASVVMLVKRGDALMNLIGGLVLLMSGVMFPVSVLPGWLQAIGSLIPLTHGLEGMRLALIRGYGLHDLSEIVVRLLIFTVVFIAAGLACFNAAVWLCKERGSLTQF